MAIADLLRNKDEEFDGDSAGIDEPADPEGADPKPKRPEGRKAKERPPPVRVTPQVRRDIHEKLTAIIDMMALTWQLRCEECGGVLEDESDKIVDRMVTVICKRPRWVEWFTSGADYQDWLMLATALQPVAIAAWAHRSGHGTHGHAGDDDDLSKYRAPQAA